MVKCLLCSYSLKLGLVLIYLFSNLICQRAGSFVLDSLWDYGSWGWTGERRAVILLWALKDIFSNEGILGSLSEIWGASLVVLCKACSCCLASQICIKALLLPFFTARYYRRHEGIDSASRLDDYACIYLTALF